MNGTLTDNAAELFPTVDDQGNVTGCITRGQAHGGTMTLHPVVHLHVFNAQGHLYLQHRPAWKDIQPDKWDTACGGHVSYGETIAQALSREVSEELGITTFTPQFLGSYIFQSSRERELVNAFRTVTSRTSFNYDPVEVDDGRFWTMQEINDAIGKGILTPNFESEFAKLLAALNK